MQNKQISPKSLIESSLQCNFKEALSKIKSHQPHLETGTAVKIIIAVCNACHDNMSKPQNIDEKSMVNLLLELPRFIHVPSNEQFQSYAQSLTFIVKMLMEKRRYELIVELEEIVAPTFMPLILTEMHQTVYKNICKLIYNSIVHFAQKKDNKSVSVVLKLSYLLAKTYKKLGQKSEILAGAYKCAQALVALEVPPSDLSEFHDDVLNLVERPDNKLYPLMIKNLNLALTYCMKENDVRLAKHCFTLSTNYLKIFKTKDFDWLASILVVADWILNVSTSKIPEEAHTSLKTYHKNYSTTPSLLAVCELISSVSYCALQMYKKSGSWDQKVEVHSSFYKLMNDISLILSKSPASGCRVCSVNLHEAVRTLDTICGLGRLAIVKGAESRGYKIEVFRILERMVELVSLLKQNQCDKWAAYWYNCSVHSSSIGMHCFQHKDVEMMMMYLKKFVTTYLKFERSEPKIVGKNYLNSVLNTISDSYFESQEWEKCMFYASLALIFSDTGKMEITRWIRAKCGSRDNSIDDNKELQELTVLSVLEKNKEIQIPELPIKRQVELLVCELRQYHSKWKSKIPMSATFHHLSTLAEPQLAAEVFIEIWGDGELQVHDNVPMLLRDTINKLKSVSKNELLLAHLYFLQHKYQVKESIIKTCDEMESTMLSPTKPSHDAEPECDLVSSYESLRLTRYTKMMRDLDKSFRMVESWMKNPTSNTSCRLFRLLSNIGHEYNLHGITGKAIRAYEMCLEVCQEEQQRLQATTYLLELTPLRENQLFSESSIQRLKSNHLEDVICFLLALSQAYFDNFSIAYPAFLRAFEWSRDATLSTVTGAKLHLMHHRFAMLPCKYNVIEHEFSLTKIYVALNRIREHYAWLGNLSSYDMKVFFEVYEVAVRMYFDLRWPQDTRAWAKEGVLIAQKLVLPFRTSFFLYYLTHTDIITHRLDSARVKLKDFTEILGVSEATGTLATAIYIPPKPKVDVLVMDFDEMMLDAPKSPKSCLKSSPGSPTTFESEGFKKAPFMSHELLCDCFYCSSWEYHDFTFKNALSHAMLHQYDGNLKLSKEFFEGCHSIYEFIRNRDEKRGGVGLREKTSETRMYYLLEYANFLYRNRRVDLAKIINQRALTKIESAPIRSYHLYNEILMQRLYIVVTKEEPPATPPPQSSNDYAQVKTPISNRPNLVNPPVLVKSPRSRKSTSKVLRFDLLDDDEDKEKKAKVTNLPKFLHPAKTPAPRKEKLRFLAELPPDVVTPRERTEYLSEQTKLLTEKLKSSSKKNDENKGAKKRDENKGKGARQNLFEQLQAADGKGAVRRSSRKK